MWWLYALLSALFASLTTIFAKVGIAGVNSNLATAIRTTVVLIMIWTIVLANKELKGIDTISKRSIIFLIISGIATGLSWIFYFKALKVGLVSHVAVMDKLSVALTVVLAACFLGEAITFKTALASILIVSGMLILLFK